MFSVLTYSTVICYEVCKFQLTSTLVHVPNALSYLTYDLCFDIFQCDLQQKPCVSSNYQHIDSLFSLSNLTFNMISILTYSTVICYKACEF
ncbi:hypothetical protein EMCRGX_G024468 [Ephydatia muelleri]